MVLDVGEKLYIVTRKNFDGDLRRHFAGEVKAVTENTVRVEGLAFVFDLNSGNFVKKPERRVRIFSLTDAAIIIIVLPATSNLEGISYQRSTGNRLVVTDGKTFTLDLNEFGVS